MEKRKYYKNPAPERKIILLTSGICIILALFFSYRVVHNAAQGDSFTSVGMVTLGTVGGILFLQWWVGSRPTAILGKKDFYGYIYELDKQGNTRQFLKTTAWSSLGNLSYADIESVTTFDYGNLSGKIYWSRNKDDWAIWIPDQLIGAEECFSVLNERIEQAKQNGKRPS